MCFPPVLCMESKPCPYCQLVMAGVFELAFSALPYLKRLLGALPASLAQQCLGYGLIWECSPVSWRPGRICVGVSAAQALSHLMVLQFGSSQPRSVKTELLTCVGLCIPGGTLFSQMLLWVPISVQPFPLISNFNYFNSSSLHTLQNHVVLVQLSRCKCVWAGCRQSYQKFVPTASMWTMKPVPNQGDAAALKHPRAYSLFV